MKKSIVRSLNKNRNNRVQKLRIDLEDCYD